MTLFMDVIFLGILSVFFWHSVLVQAGFDPVNLTVHTLNLNLTLTWASPQVDVLVNESFRYIVTRTSGGSPKRDVPHCVNITETFCSLVPVFPAGRGFVYREYFMVKALSNLSNITNVREGKDKTSFSGYSIDVSAPVVYNHTITHRNITLWIRGPETPFEQNGRKLIMIEEGVGLGKSGIGGLRFQDLYVNASLFKCDNQNNTAHPETLERLNNGRLKLVYTGLNPNTKYVIKMQSIYRTKFSADISTFVFRTVQSAPDFGPFISGFQTVSRYCDFRDVNVTWEERQSQRQAVNLTHYKVSFKSVEKANNDINLVVPASVQLMTVSGLSRWLKYHVTITSINSGGKKAGQMSVLEKDSLVAFIDTYKANITGFTPVSPSEGTIFWKPPLLHEQCILGYNIKTYIGGSLEQTFTVDGYNTSSAIIVFKKSGKYEIDVIPIYNDTEGTVVAATYSHTSKGQMDMPAWNGNAWVILSTVIFFLIVILSAVILMTRKLICIMGDLPDISKSTPLRIASNDHYVNTSLKQPPEKEIFHSIRGSRTEIKCKTEYPVDHEDNDVFHPTSTSETPLLPLDVRKDKSEVDPSEEIVEVQLPEKEEIKDGRDAQQEAASVKCQIQNDDTSTTVHVTTSLSNMEVSVTSHVDGYVARAPTKNPLLTVSIPKDLGYCPTSSLSAQSSSADSGICSSPPFGLSFTDYVPPSPFADFSIEVNTTSDSEEFPYVKAELAVTSGRIQSYSVSSDTGSDCPNYNRIDSRQSVSDPSPKGYLPMSPSYPIGRDGSSGTLGQRPCSYFFPSYNKPSPKRFSQT